MVKPVDPFDCIADRSPKNDATQVKAFSVPPLSPVSKNMMRKSHILISNRQIPVWVDTASGIVYPCHK